MEPAGRHLIMSVGANSTSSPDRVEGIEGATKGRIQEGVGFRTVNIERDDSRTQGFTPLARSSRRAITRDDPFWRILLYSSVEASENAAFRSFRARW
jgi:hypothetical protein